MVKLELLSKNLISILNEIKKNQNLCKYLYYNTTNPVAESDFDTSCLLVGCDVPRLFPYPFVVTSSDEEICKIHVYYPNGQFVNRVVENSIIYFDIICAKTLWLTNSGVRPYEIMTEVLNSFDELNIGTIGTLLFKRFDHIAINEKFDCIRLRAEAFTLGH